MPKAALRGAIVFVAAFATGALSNSSNLAAQELDFEKIFFCHEGEMTGEQTYEECMAARDTTLITCTACHVFTPFVKAQKTAEEWDTFMDIHRTRVKEVSDADYAEITKFLKSHFNPENPVPQLPPELENYTLPPA
ncbi:MAG: hypothetical protein RLN70_11885 [Rhodospirillaceae bacterium]